MFYSMTGFGRSEYEDKKISLAVELKSLNHRFLETSFYLPEGFGIFEEKLRLKVAKIARRGRIFINIRYQSNESADARIIINKKLLKNAVNELKKAARETGLRENLSMKDVMGLPGIVKVSPRLKKFDYLWPRVSVAVDKALRDLMRMRKREGVSLKKDIVGNVNSIRRELGWILKESPKIVKDFQQKLKSRIVGYNYSKEKLAEEAGVFARSIDISEEIVRLKTHLNNFLKIVRSQDSEKGRTLDFLAQEMQREANTIGAKSSSALIAKKVVAIKSKIDKIREQLSNIE